MLTGKTRGRLRASCKIQMNSQGDPEEIDRSGSQQLEALVGLPPSATKLCICVSWMCASKLGCRIMPGTFKRESLSVPPPGISREKFHIISVLVNRVEEKQARCADSYPGNQVLR